MRVESNNNRLSPIASERQKIGLMESLRKYTEYMVKTERAEHIKLYPKYNTLSVFIDRAQRALLYKP